MTRAARRLGAWLDSPPGLLATCLVLTVVVCAALAFFGGVGATDVIYGRF